MRILPSFLLSDIGARSFREANLYGGVLLLHLFQRSTEVIFLDTEDRQRDFLIAVLFRDSEAFLQQVQRLLYLFPG